MWESLPPVVPASSTPAGELTGVSVATHLSGMISGPGNTAPKAYVPSTSMLMPGGHGEYSSDSTNQQLAATSAPDTAGIVRAPTATPANSNPFATARAAPPALRGTAGGNDWYTQPNVKGAPHASQFYSPMASVSQMPLPADFADSSLTSAVMTASAATATATTAIDVASGRSSVSGFPAAPQVSTKAPSASPPQHVLSPYSIQHPAPRPPLSQSPSVLPLSCAAAAHRHDPSNILPRAPQPVSASFDAACLSTQTGDRASTVAIHSVSSHYSQSDVFTSVQAAPPSNTFNANAPWQSSELISNGIAGDANDGACALSALSGGGGAPSAAPMAPSSTADHQHQAHSALSGVNAVAAAESPADRLDVTASQADASASVVGSPFPRVSQLIFQPAHSADVVPSTVLAPATSDTEAVAALVTPASSFSVAPASVRPPFPGHPPSFTAAAGGSGTSLTFTSPCFHTAERALGEPLAPSSLPGAMPIGVSTEAQSQNSFYLGQCQPPTLVHLQQQMQPSLSTRPTTTANNWTGTPTGLTSVGPFRITQSTVPVTPIEQRGPDAVHTFGMEPTSLMSRARASPIPSTAGARDVHHRYAMPPGLNGVGLASHNGMLTQNTDATGLIPPFSSSTANAAHAWPSTSPQGAEDCGGYHVNGDAARHAVSPSPTSSNLAQHHALPLSSAPMGGIQNVHTAPVATAGDAPDALCTSFVPGSIDHNQSFYFGTAGNDNLRRSFFFPITARPAMGEREDGTELNAVDEAAGRSNDLAPYLRRPGLPSSRTGSAEAPRVPSPSTSRMQVPASRSLPTEAVGSGEGYCSPALYRVPSFSSTSPLQLPVAPSQSLAPAAAPSSMAAGDSTSKPAVTRGNPLLPAQQRPQWAPPHAVPQPTPKRVVPPPLVPQAHLQHSLSEDPLRTAAGGSGGSGRGGRPHAGAPNAVVSALSSNSRSSSMASGAGDINNANRSGSSRTTAVADGPWAVSMNASFISPTLANSMARRRFEDFVSASEVSLPLSESGAHAAIRNAAKVASKITSPLSLSITMRLAPDMSQPRTPQPAAAAAGVTTAPVGPVPAYILDWERSLAAFQTRAESYYTFKNVCTETYLTLIEHDVDRFLVCYYSGGAVKPEEAVQGALASRARTSGATTQHVRSNTMGIARGGGTAGDAQRGGSFHKSIQASKTLQKLSEAGSKWLMNLRRAAMPPLPQWGDAKPSSFNAGTVALLPPVCSAASSNSSALVDSFASTQAPLHFSSLSAAARPSMEGVDEWWMTTETPTTAEGNFSNNSVEIVEPTYSVGGQPTSRETGNAFYASSTEATSTDVAQQLTNPLSFSGKSSTTASISSDTLSTTSLSRAAGAAAIAGGGGGVVSILKAPPLSRLSYNIAAEEELQRLRQLGPYLANVIPETYMDMRPSEQVLQHVQRNYPIILNALQHVLLMNGGESPPAWDAAARHARNAASLPVSSGASEAAKMLIATRIRQGLLVPSIVATWRDYLSPLEMKVKELVQIATTNIDPILDELQSVPTDGVATAEMSSSALTDLYARQRLRASREQPVRRLARLLRGDEEYLTSIHIMDDEFIENGEAWRSRSAAMRDTGAALSDYVPVYGLVLSRLHRLEMEHRTVLELWCGGAPSALAPSTRSSESRPA
ncbi:hypothetical protein ABL78_3010 [Leptomonas seymouri]|uniref:Uncharacterized protein n=1 Tax=Leptomonas seymouri TaxID=5684 RepID=A0A0N1ILK6_LEPSE|nr:hypothetical protein ABL78_3010 [Leptomonas seymouri]|eukprot:KPI87900.1 hypothetical protein ABL78_3010 [Leptomonas seymouri]